MGGGTRARSVRLWVAVSVVVIGVALVAWAVNEGAGTGEVDVADVAPETAPSTPAPTSSSSAPTTAPTTTVSSSSVPAEVAETVGAVRRDAALAAGSGNAELAASLDAAADDLVAAAREGRIGTTMTEMEIRDLLGLGSTNRGPHFDPEGPWECEPPLVPREYVTPDSTCHIFTDEAAATADVVAVTPTAVLAIGLVEPLDDLIDRAVEMVLADPDRIDEALALVDSGATAGAAPSLRVVAEFDPPLDLGEVTVDFTRDGADYLVTVGDTAYPVGSTRRPGA